MLPKRGISGDRKSIIHTWKLLGDTASARPTHLPHLYIGLKAPSSLSTVTISLRLLEAGALSG